MFDINLRNIFVLAFAILLAFIAVFIAQGWLREQAKTVIVQQEAETTDVVVAAMPLYFGNTIRHEHLKIIKWPAGTLPQGTFNSFDQIVGDEDEPRHALRTIEPDEPILHSKVSGFGERVSLSSLIPDGMRAITIRVNDVKGVAGFIMPGDRVDILLTRPYGKKDFINNVLIQNVKVLGIDQDANEDRDQPTVVRAVTLQTTPIQSQKLTLAEQMGHLSLALRGVTNVDIADTRTIRVSDLNLTDANDVKKKKPVRRKIRYSPYASVKVFRAFESKKYSVLKDNRTIAAVSNSARQNTGPLRNSSINQLAPSLSEISTAAGSKKSLPEFDKSAEKGPINLLPKEKQIDKK